MAEGDSCRKCGTSLEKRTPRGKRKATRSYYFEWYLYCPGCKTLYMVDEAKRSIDRSSSTLLDVHRED